MQTMKVAGVMFGLFMLVGWLFASSYPYASLTYETAGYLSFAEDFNFFSLNWSDPWRLPGYSFILSFALFFKEPAITILWLQLGLFCLAATLVGCLFYHLLKSRLAGVCLGVTFFLIELSFMHVFIGLTQIFADSPFALIILISTVLWWWGYKRQSVWWLSSAYACFGYALLIKQVAIALVPLWILITWYLVRTWHGRVPFTKKFLSICCTLALAPFLIWSLRSVWFYGSFSPTVLGPNELLARVLPLVEDTDQLFANHTENDQFINQLRQFESTIGTNHNDYAWHGHNQGGPLYWLRLKTPIAKAVKSPTWQQVVKREFEQAPLNMALALKIIRLHPERYLKLVATDYYRLFTPGQPWRHYQENLHRHASAQYHHLMAESDQYGYQLFYPQGINLSLNHQSVTTWWYAILGNNRVRGWFTFLPWWHGALVHIIALTLAIWLWRHRSAFKTTTYQLGALSLFCFLVTASIYALTSATDPPIDRYTYIGTLHLHLMYLCLVVLIMRKYVVCSVTR